MEGRGLTNITADAFSSNTALLHLFLSNNQLTSLPAGLFDTTTALAVLLLLPRRAAAARPPCKSKRGSRTLTPY